MRQTNRRQFIGRTLGIGGLFGIGAWSLNSLTRRSDRPSNGFESMLRPIRRETRALGTTVSLTVLHPDEWMAEQSIRAAFAELERVEELMSIYRPESQLSRLNRHGFLAEPHPYLVQVLETGRAVSQRSDGAFDVSVQPLWRLFSAAQRDGRVPRYEEIEAARRLVDWRKVQMNQHAIRLGQPGMALTLNGIAQGFAADRVAAVLGERGIEHAIIDTGEIHAIGAKSPDEDWTVGIQHPRRDDAYLALARLRNRCLATSGDYSTHFSSDFRSNHIFDPRTGQSPDVFSSVSVAAPSCIEADALSTAIFVLGLTRGLELIRVTPGADAQFVLKDGRAIATDGFPVVA